MATHDERLSALEAKFQQHDTLITGEMGIVKALQALQKSVNELKEFQIKALTLFGVAAILIQIVIQVMIKK